VRSDVNRAIWKIFRANGVKIPVAQRELRMLEKAPPMTISRTPPDAKPGSMDFDDNAE
jgi:small-conductance mechanosensitive channel